MEKHEYEEYEDVGYIDGLRCLGLSTGDFVNMTDEEKATFSTDLIYNMVYNAIDNLSYDDPTLDPFTSYCEDYYYEYFDEVELPAGMDPENLTIKDMYTLGFLEEADRDTRKCEERDSYISDRNNRCPGGSNRGRQSPRKLL